MRYIVRTEPGAVDAVYTELEEMMLEANPGRIVRVETMFENKRDTYEVSLAMIKMLGTIGFIFPSFILQIFCLPLAVQQLYKGVPFHKRRQMDKPIPARHDAEEIVPVPISSPAGYLLPTEIANHDVL